jgi:hypothetical protein
MKTKEIIKLGTTLGLKFDEKTCYPHDLENNVVVFNGINGQRFLIDGNDMSDEEILSRMGDALQLMGRRQLKMELHTLLNITSDN